MVWGRRKTKRNEITFKCFSLGIWYDYEEYYFHIIMRNNIITLYWKYYIVIRKQFPIIKYMMSDKLKNLFVKLPFPPEFHCV